MYKFVILAALVAVASAAPGGLIAPVVAAPYAVAHSVPVATSYANTYKVSVKSPIIAAPAAPLAYAAAPAYVKAAPAIAYSAPVAYSAHVAPISYAAAPAAYVHGAPLAYAAAAHYVH